MRRLIIINTDSSGAIKYQNKYSKLLKIALNIYDYLPLWRKVSHCNRQTVHAGKCFKDISFSIFSTLSALILRGFYGKKPNITAEVEQNQRILPLFADE